MTTTVFVLIAAYATSTFWTAEPTIHVETVVFQTAERCLRNVDSNEKRIKDQGFKILDIKCLTKTVETGK